MKYAVIVLVLLLSMGSWAQDLYFPPNGSTSWETIPPKDLGYCTQQIDALYQYLEANNTNAFILLKDGKIVLFLPMSKDNYKNDYFEGYDG